MRQCSRCGHCHLGVLLMPRVGWLLVFLAEFENAVSELELDYQLWNQTPLISAPSNVVRFIELANS